MAAQLVFKRRLIVATDAFVELVLWRVPHSVRGSRHNYKYSFAYVVDGSCVVRYDNEAGKGDHRHDGETENSVEFSSPNALLDNFWSDVARWNDENRSS